MHPESVNCRFATTVHLILPVNDVSTLIAVTAQAFSAQHFKGCEQEVAHVTSGSDTPVLSARWTGALQLGRLLLRMFARATLFAISRFVAPNGSSARQYKIQTVKIPVFIFMAVHTMKLNHSQHNRASETRWSFL